MQATQTKMFFLFIGFLFGASVINADTDNFVNRYGQWKNGPPSDPGYFPIAVWLQSPHNAEKYKKAGINLYIGLWEGPTEEQLSTLKKAGLRVICDRNAVGIAHKDDSTIAGWMHNDEPDNAQPVTDPNTGKQTYGPPIDPAKIVQDYQALRESDPTRPVFLNLGQGVANDEWVGRGEWGKKEDYYTYVKGCDILSFDVYPVTDTRKTDGENYLWLVAQGVERLIKWNEGQKTVWNCIECTHISNEKAKATSQQVKAEIWMSIIHGSMGIVYFVHEFKPAFNEDALLDDPEMLAAVTAINQQIHSLAPVLNSPTVARGVQVESSKPDVPIAALTKRLDGKTYVFAVGMRNGETQAKFTLSGSSPQSRLTVLQENREISIQNNQFTDVFAPYGVHIYEIQEDTNAVDEGKSSASDAHRYENQTEKNHEIR
jgi:hypothetical protein